MKTYTPGLDPAALARLRDYAALFATDFPQSKPARWAGAYPLALRLFLPESWVADAARLDRAGGPRSTDLVSWVLADMSGQFGGFTQVCEVRTSIYAKPGSS